jgi:hypothetical protein
MHLLKISNTSYLGLFTEWSGVLWLVFCSGNEEHACFWSEHAEHACSLQLTCKSCLMFCNACLFFCRGNAKHVCFSQRECKACLFSVVKIQSMLVVCNENAKLARFCRGNKNHACFFTVEMKEHVSFLLWNCKGSLFFDAEIKKSMLVFCADVKRMFVYCCGNAKYA